VTYTVSDLVSEFLVRCGVETAFGIVSVHNIPMLDAIAGTNRIHVVPTRGEAGASHMADGYGRASRKLAVLITSTGPGAANAVVGLVEARTAGTPVLHLTGHTSTRFADRGMGTVHDVPDQLGMLGRVCKAAYRIRSAQQALGVLTRAATEALSPPCGPVSIEVPIDIQRSAVDRPAAFDDFALTLPAPLPPSAHDLDELVRLASAARRPMLWLGRGAADAGAPARALLDLGFGMVTSWAGRGVVPETHPMNLGSLNGAGLPDVEAFYETVDLMLVAGSRVRGHETLEFAVRLPKTLAQIDIDPLANGRTYVSRLFVHGDARLTLAALAERLRPAMNVDPGFGDAFRALKEATRNAFRATLGPYATFAEQLRGVMPDNVIWARDVTINNSTWGNKLLPLQDPTTNIYPMGAGIGQGLCMAIGAALAPGGRKVVAMTGDGGFFFNLGELWTATQENADLTIIVMNDRGYGVIRHIQDAAAGGRRRFDNVLGPDLEGLARLAGIPYRRVARPEEFGAMAAEAIAVTGPSLVEVDMTSIGQHPPYFPYGPKAAASHQRP
jgi:acetolactate synthase I/II/III large subunit